MRQEIAKGLHALNISTHSPITVSHYAKKAICAVCSTRYNASTQTQFKSTIILRLTDIYNEQLIKYR